MAETIDKLNWPFRLARLSDIPELESLIAISVRVLQAPYYSVAQREGALGKIFGVDTQLIRDGTYFVLEQEAQIIGCGGWSKRKTLCGGDRDRVGEDDLLDPRSEGARIRAFFVHPDWARRGIGASILRACEKAIVSAGFETAELLATLAGEPLYASFEYKAFERYDLPMSSGLSLPVVRMGKRLSG
ncbi:MAG: GCN5-related N-acetyltransferase [Verrucomicrobiales bacterium]|nr:GCN5-related N-acetyltransferase [Verrucomicrobiales bacterium]